VDIFKALTEIDVQTILSVISPNALAWAFWIFRCHLFYFIVLSINLSEIGYKFSFLINLIILITQFVKFMEMENLI